MAGFFYWRQLFGRSLRARLSALVLARSSLWAIAAILNAGLQSFGF